ncbi:hypothetical protein STH2129 [Symbiobacterium thermophilum IAM 14863]|uniref:Uncharacterized protein n=1 Tax=Symbiobacterium thermophilum (strain DSM 24528 / JCM 14929 / IAM 14863 / T) TaxID=292459 RepID=Q67MH9_SYMTH|nr:hypothetical protein STH2129 [Symbiobacterium thermophilum IAM 14863]
MAHLDDPAADRPKGAAARSRTHASRMPSRPRRIVPPFPARCRRIWVFERYTPS